MLYRVGSALHHGLFDLGLRKTQASSLPVISIGNCTVGGSGKSPFARYVCSVLLERGYHPVLLSRGYGGLEKGPYEVTSADNAKEVGDEALMQKLFFGDSISVVVSAKRVDGARFIEERALGDVIVLDDAFQHRPLERDLNLLLIDSSSDEDIRSILEERFLPLGRLRESAAKARQRADAVVLVSRGGSSKSVEGLSTWVGDLPKLSFELRAIGYVDIFSGERLALDAFDGKEATAITAIAKPESFFASLRAEGVRLESEQSFRDHYQFSFEDWTSVSKDLSRPVLCTEKDATKLRAFVKRAGQAFYLELEGKLDSPERFFDLLALPEQQKSGNG